MKLLKLKLENFRQHLLSEITFEDGLTAIVGANGTGKSTIIEGITYALYGEQRGTKDSIRFLWAEGKKFKVSLEFELGGNRYLSWRSHDDAAFCEWKDGVWAPLAIRLGPALKRAERELGLTYEQFKNSFCAEQKDLAFLQFKDNKQRQTEVAKMLGYEIFQSASDLGKGRHAALKSEIYGIEMTLGDPIKIETEMMEETRVIGDAQEILKASQATLKDLAEREPGIVERHAKAERYLLLAGRLDDLSKGADNLKETRAAATARVEKAQADDAKRIELAPVAVRYGELENALKEFERLRGLDEDRQKRQVQFELANRAIGTLEAEIAALPLPDLSAAKAKVQEALVKATAANALHQQLSNELGKVQVANAKAVAGAKATIAQVDKEQSDAKALIASGKCPKCGQPTTGDTFTEILEELAKRATLAADAHHEIVSAGIKAESEAQAKLDAAAKARDEALGEHSLAQTAEAESNNQFRLRDAKVQELNKQRTDRDRIEKELSVPSPYDGNAHGLARKERENLSASYAMYLAVAGAEKALAGAKADLEQETERFNKARDEYRSAKEEKGTLGFESDEQARAAVEEMASLKTQRAVLENQQANAEQTIKTAKTRRKQAEERLEALKVQRSVLVRKQHELSVCETTYKELLRCRQELSKRIKPELESLASEHLEQLTGGRYSKLTLDDNFQPKLHDEDRVKDIISGGEQDTVALALRLALSEQIQLRQGRQLSLLVLDEIFGSLDPQRRDLVLTRLDYLKAKFDQILMISHIEEINERADRTIRVERNPATKAAVVSDGSLKSAISLFDAMLIAPDDDF